MGWPRVQPTLRHTPFSNQTTSFRVGRQATQRRKKSLMPSCAFEKTMTKFISKLSKKTTDLPSWRPTLRRRKQRSVKFHATTEEPVKTQRKALPICIIWWRRTTFRRWKRWVTTTCLIAWRGTSFHSRLPLTTSQSQSDQRRASQTMSKPNSWRPENRTCSPSTDLSSWWTTWIVINWNVRKELSHLTLRSKIRRKLSRSVMIGLYARTILERLLRTKARIKTSWKCATSSTSRCQFPIILKSAWRKKWRKIPKQKMHSNRCALVPGTPTLKKWLWSSLLETRLTLHCSSQSARMKRSTKY